MITALHQVFGRKYAGVATVGNNSTEFIGFISTRNGNVSVDWGDGVIENITTYKNVDFTNYPEGSANGRILHTYSSASIRDIKINLLNGFNDMYSLKFSSYYGSYYNMLYILDWGAFIKQFTNLYSFYYNVGTPGQTIKGDLSQIPNSLERIYIGNIALQNNTDLYLNLSNFSSASQLKYFSSGFYPSKSFQNIYGDLSKLPPLINYFLLSQNLANTLTYTAGRIWASSFDTLDIGNATLSATETDNLFNDMANSITTAIGSKIIRLANCYRTPASNPAVTYLQSLGFTITVAGIGSKILDLPLQNNFTDTTGFNTIVAGGTSNLPTFTLEVGEYAATFNGSQSLKTNANFNINSDKVSISLWIKTSQTAGAVISEISQNYATNNAFGVFINDVLSNRIEIADRNSGFNLGNSTVNINDNAWKHVVLMIDRSKAGNQQNSIYVDGVLSYVQATAYQTDNNGNFGLYPLFIGQRAGNSIGFNGQLKFLKIYNYHLSQTEITNLLNKTM